MKTTKAILIILLIAFLLVLIFGVIAILVLALSGASLAGWFNWFGESDNLVLEKTYETSEFKNLDVFSTVGNIKIENSDTKDVMVKIYADDKVKEGASSEINDETLNVKMKESDSNCHFLCFTKNPKIVISMPSEFAGKINVKSSTGNVKIGSFKDAEMIVDLSTGNTKIEAGKNLDLNSSTGNIEVETGYNRVKIHNDTGNVRVEKLELLEDSEIMSDTGNVKVKDPGDNVYVEAKNDTGHSDIQGENDRKADVKLYIEVDTGNINVR